MHISETTLTKRLMECESRSLNVNISERLMKYESRSLNVSLVC